MARNSARCARLPEVDHGLERGSGAGTGGRGKIELSEAHWEVVHFVRAFYLEFNTSPAVRMLVKAMAQKYGEDKGNSRYLFRLFPKGPAKQATKIAGLPKPAKCL